MVGSKYDLELSQLTEAATNLQNFYNLKMGGFLLASDSDASREDTKYAHQKRRKTSLSKHQGSQKLSEEMPPHIKEVLKKESRKSLKQLYAVHKIIDEAMLEMYQNDSFPESSTGDEDLGEMGNIVQVKYDPRYGVVRYTTKTGETNVVLVKENILSKGRGKRKLMSDRGIIFDTPVVILNRGKEIIENRDISTEPEIEEYSSPYTTELIRANESW